jgi:hypothetical protein
MMMMQLRTSAVCVLVILFVGVVRGASCADYNNSQSDCATFGAAGGGSATGSCVWCGTSATLGDEISFFRVFRVDPNETGRCSSRSWSGSNSCPTSTGAQQQWDNQCYAEESVTSCGDSCVGCPAFVAPSQSIYWGSGDSCASNPTVPRPVLSCIALNTGASIGFDLFTATSYRYRVSAVLLIPLLL